MAPNEKDYLEVAYQRAIDKKTHVSFPQLKYPSLRDKLNDPVRWLQGKALDDGAEGLWRVHNGLYDLSDFVRRHPGGAEWLDLSKGTDITEAFESHHYVPAVIKTLQKFHIRDAKTPRNSPFTFEENGFYRSLKDAVMEELKKIPKNVHKKADMIINGLLITLILTSVLSCWAKNSYVVWASYFTASLSLAWAVVASHNYIHRKPNWRMYIFNLALWSYRDFRISHVLSHHLYPNTLMDLEISIFEPLIFWIPNRDKPYYVKFSLLYEMLFYPFAFLINFIARLCYIYREGVFSEHGLRWHDAVGFLLPIWMFVASGETFINVFVMWLWILCTASTIFFIIGTNAAHHHPKIWKDGDEVDTVTPDWGMHELEAVADRTDVNDNIFKVMTLFGDHALHHLFPTIDHAVLPYLYPIFYKYCKQYRANFRMTTQLDLLIGQIKMTMKTEPTLLKDKWLSSY